MLVHSDESRPAFIRTTRPVARRTRLVTAVQVVVQVAAPAAEVTHPFLMAAPVAVTQASATAVLADMARPDHTVPSIMAAPVAAPPEAILMPAMEAQAEAIKAEACIAHLSRATATA